MDIKKYQDQSGDVIADTIKHGILAGGMKHEKVRDHIRLFSAQLNTYPKLRDEILHFTRSGRTWGSDDSSAPMQIDAITGKGKGAKGKDSKKGKGKENSGKAGKTSKEPAASPPANKD
eukprot:6294829-Amphidinium_carterae.1